MSYDLPVRRSQQIGSAFTVATLPSLSQMVGEPIGMLAYTVDGGLYAWNGTTWVAVAAGAALALGITPITGGTSGYVLYDNAGVVGELANTGTGNNVLANSPALITPSIDAATGVSLALSSATGLTLGGSVLAKTKVTTFTSNGTYTPASGAIATRVIICAAGGSGGAGTTTASGTANSGGGGGGGGAYFDVTFPTSSLGGSVSVTVPAGPTSPPAGTSGSVGGNASFGTFVIAYGGGGGAVGQSAANSGGGGGAGTLQVGGSTTSSTAGTAGSSSGVAGGSGAAGQSAGSPAGGGGGGGGLNGGVGQVSGRSLYVLGGASGGGSGGGVSTAPATFAGGDGLLNNSTTHTIAGTAGSGSNGGAGASPPTLAAYIANGGGAGGGSAISTFTGGKGGDGGFPGGGGGGGGSALTTGVAGAGGAGGAGVCWVVEYF